MSGVAVPGWSCPGCSPPASAAASSFRCAARSARRECCSSRREPRRGAPPARRLGVGSTARAAPASCWARRRSRSSPVRSAARTRIGPSRVARARSGSPPTASPTIATSPTKRPTRHASNRRSERRRPAFGAARAVSTRRRCRRWRRPSALGSRRCAGRSSCKGCSSRSPRSPWPGSSRPPRSRRVALRDGRPARLGDVHLRLPSAAGDARPGGRGGRRRGDLGTRKRRVAVPDDVYRGDLAGERGLLRWLLAGLGFGTAATLQPAYLLLAVPALAALPTRRRAGAAALFAAGWVPPLLAALAVTGAPWEPLQLVADLPLLGWNLVYFGCGRHVGVLLYFLPLGDSPSPRPRATRGDVGFSRRRSLQRSSCSRRRPSTSPARGGSGATPPSCRSSRSRSSPSAGRRTGRDRRGTTARFALVGTALALAARRRARRVGIRRARRARARAGVRPTRPRCARCPRTPASSAPASSMRSTGWEVFAAAEGRGLVFLGRGGASRSIPSGRSRRFAWSSGRPHHLDARGSRWRGRQHDLPPFGGGRLRRCGRRRGTPSSGLVERRAALRLLSRPAARRAPRRRCASISLSRVRPHRSRSSRRRRRGSHPARAGSSKSANGSSARRRTVCLLARAGRAAVLVPLFAEGRELWALLTRRAETLPQHRGQIAFPAAVARRGGRLGGGAARERGGDWPVAPRRPEAGRVDGSGDAERLSHRPLRRRDPGHLSRRGEPGRDRGGLRGADLGARAPEPGRGPRGPHQRQASDPQDLPRRTAQDLGRDRAQPQNLLERLGVEGSERYDDERRALVDARGRPLEWPAGCRIHSAALDGSPCSSLVLLVAGVPRAAGQEAAATPQPESAAGTFSERVEVTAVTVPVRVRLPKGAPPLAPNEIVVVEGGKTWPVLALETRSERPAPAASARPAPAEPAAPEAPVAEAARRPWRIVVYFDLQLAGIPSVRQAAWQLGGRADELAESRGRDRGRGRRPRPVLAPSRDADAIRRARASGSPTTSASAGWCGCVGSSSTRRTVRSGFHGAVAASPVWGARLRSHAPSRTSGGATAREPAEAGRGLPGGAERAGLAAGGLPGHRRLRPDAGGVLPATGRGFERARRRRRQRGSREPPRAPGPGRRDANARPAARRRSVGCR